MKKFAMVAFLALALAGCASPAQDYVEADAATWDTPIGKGIDSRVDALIEADKTWTYEEKDALHELMKAKRARIAHALAQFAPKAAK